MKFSRLLTTISLLMLALTAGSPFAADSTNTGWKQSLIIDLTATQTAYSDSWSGGEAGAFNWVGNINGSAEKQFSPGFNFRSALKVSFGQTFSQDPETKIWSKPAKSTDLIDWENLARFTLRAYLDPFVALRLETQFLDASFGPRNRFLSPMKLTESIGVAHMFHEKEKDRILSRFGLALKQTITKTITDSTLLTVQNETAIDGGLESVTDLALTFGENLKYTGKLTLYKAMFFSRKDKVAGTEAEDYWKAVDVNFENIINASITKVVSVNMYLQLLFDKEISRKGRFKETLGLGIVFKLI